jgi:xanthine/CO dehydrogenase XdhC/CoxF family maturation factor
MQTISLDADNNVATVREWCVDHGVTAAIEAVIYRGRIRHYHAAMSDDDAFLFRLCWNEKTRPTAVVEPGPCTSADILRFSRP